MAYADFDAAWTAWSNMYVGYFNEMGWTATAVQQISTATSWTQLRGYVWSACNHLRLLMNAHAKAPSSSVMDSSHYAATYYAWSEGGEVDPYELTMDKMLEAMWDGDLLRWFHFVTYIDSMRAGIWNLEIYETHLSDLYRHFSV